MLTIEVLKEYGANVQEGLTRCVNNEQFYLKLVGKALADTNYERLLAAVEKKDLDDAFEAAHALKGAWSNLALTPLSQPVSEMTDLLRNRTDMDYSPYIETIKEKKEELEKLME
ncbi:MAG: Hpt domain-containing protein [Lachnospiraceae bacterium]|nr:Hpt domain-containing protein [Lachnospiraceae bacterium]